MKNIQRDLSGLRLLYRLKNVDRTSSVKERPESSAEHSWSCLILADHFMQKINLKLDRLKVFELLLYHDVVEIEAGDICISKEEERKNKRERELKAMEKLKEEMPPLLKEKFVSLYLEFEEMKTLEAKFAQSIDKLDAEIQELDYQGDWKGWTEEFLRKKKEPYFKEFPEIREIFEEATKIARKNGYFK